MNLVITHCSGGRFAELIVQDFEDESVKARSGLLDASERSELAARLREIADQLEAVGLVHDGVRRAAA